MNSARPYSPPTPSSSQATERAGPASLQAQRLSGPARPLRTAARRPTMRQARCTPCTKEGVSLLSYRDDPSMQNEVQTLLQPHQARQALRAAKPGYHAQAQLRETQQRSCGAGGAGGLAEGRAPQPATHAFLVQQLLGRG